ncbi:aromatic amino acid lyase, partial [Streptomyces niveus]|uniref:aromatic amino acid lyase n=1 Tax=Streptomyces niveus TaxID=193462 RepID=UPI003F65403D
MGAGGQGVAERADDGGPQSGATGEELVGPDGEHGADLAGGLRLLRSHAGAVGNPLPAREVRAMLAVRANQLLAGGAGLRPTVVGALCDALAAGAHPVVNEFGSVGTGDIAALSQL